MNVSVGGTGEVTAIVVAVDGYAGPEVAVSLQNPPSNLTAGCDPPSIPPTAACTLILFAGSRATPGAYSVIVQASNGSAMRTALLAVNITPQTTPGDFTVSGLPSPVPVRAGESVSTSITLSIQGGFSGSVLFSASGLPADVGYRFDPASLATSGTTTLSFVAAPNASVGTYAVLVKGISGSIERGTSVSLQVLPAEFRLIIATSPAGLRVEVDGENETTPYTLNCTAGTDHTISAPGSQSLGSTAYVFSSWSDGLDRTHQVACQGSGTLVATYSASAEPIVGVSLPAAAGIAFVAVVAGWLLGWTLLRRRRTPSPEPARMGPAAPVEPPKPTPRLTVDQKLSMLEERKARGAVSETLYRELREKLESEKKTSRG